MRKSKFLFRFGFFTIQSLVFCCAFISCTNIEHREIISLNGQWKFCVDSANQGVPGNWNLNGLPNELTRTVTVPHAWNAEKGLEKYWGTCWYERDFEVSQKQLSKTTRLQFDAVYHDAIIYVNGKKAGEHLGSGYNRFFVNVSPYIMAGTNTLRVCADNSPSRSNIPFMRSFDWANDGGIYRNVNMVVTENQAIRNIHVSTTPNGIKGFANIKVSFLDTIMPDPARLILEGSITEENQTTKNQIFKGNLIGKYENGSFVCSLKFDTINPWHFDSPNLYKLIVKLKIDGLEKDEYSTVFGFRSIKVENNRYILNGEPIRLMGVEWMPGSSLEHGMAETPGDFEKNLTLMKNANCIFTRFHWQQDEYIFDWCDRNGMLIQEEIPYWGGVTILNDTLLAKGFQHLDEMTDAHYNHPSIIIWGIGNELDSHNPINKISLKLLYNYAKSLDSSRLVSYVSNRLGEDFPGEGNPEDATSDFDMMMFNEYYSTWYNKTVDVVPGELDRINLEYPGKPITISEWGICEPAHKGGDKRRVKEMIHQIIIYGSKPYIAGAIYFCLNDYRTHMGEDFTYSYPQRVHGVVDIKLNTKPSYDTLKTYSSPIEIKQISDENGKTMLKIVGKTGLPSYTIRNYFLIAGKDTMQIDELKPGEEKIFELISNEKDIGIFRPTGFAVIRLKLK